MASLRGLCLVALLASVPLLAGERSERLSPQETKAEILRRHVPAVAPAAAKAVSVDCTKGDRIQTAIDKNPSPVVVNIHGICVESVFVIDKDVTLRGTDPATDGISGTGVTLPVTQIGLVEFRYSNTAGVENLSITNSPTLGVVSYFTNLTLLRSRITNHAGIGMHLSALSFVNGTELTVSNNVGTGVQAQRGALFQCHGCVFQDNRQAVRSILGGFVTLQNPTIIGRHGIDAFDPGSYADIDCLTEAGMYPCSVNVAGPVAFALGGGNAVLYGAGDFTGGLRVSESSSMTIYNSRQVALGPPGSGGAHNFVDSMSSLMVEMDPSDGGGPSQIMGATVSSFGRLAIGGTSTLTDTVQCDSAGDAWFDPTITKGAGAAVSGCAHATLP